MWDDPDVVEAHLALGKPFYTALGHSTNVLLADRFNGS
jgi:exonuclease VII large subunit